MRRSRLSCFPARWRCATGSGLTAHTHRELMVDRRTGELRPVELFVSMLGASSLTYAEATETQQLPDWVNAHIRMAEYFGGSTTMWVPD